MQPTNRFSQEKARRSFRSGGVKRRGRFRLKVVLHPHSETFDRCAVEAVVFSRRQIRVLWNEERIIAEVRLSVLEHEPHILGRIPGHADLPSLHLAAERNAV